MLTLENRFVPELSAAGQPRCRRCKKSRVLPRNTLCVPCQQQELNRIRALDTWSVEIPIERGKKP